MITPSSPTHEYDYQIHYFQAEKRQPGFFSSIRDAFTPGSRSSYIALPESPNPNYLPTTTTQRSSWSVSKRFRAVLLLAACLFFMLHLCVLPKVADHGLYDVFTAHSGSQQMDDAVALWEVVPGTPVDAYTTTPEPETTPVAFDADDTVGATLF